MKIACVNLGSDTAVDNDFCNFMAVYLCHKNWLFWKSSAKRKKCISN